MSNKKAGFSNQLFVYFGNRLLIDSSLWIFEIAFPKRLDTDTTFIFL